MKLDILLGLYYEIENAITARLPHIFSFHMIEFSTILNSLRNRLVCDSFDKNDMKASIHSSQIKRIFGASKSQVKNFEVQICSFHFPPIALAISKSILHSPHVLT